MNFDAAFIKLMHHEGYYSDDAHDPGGETTWGITEKVARENGYLGHMRDLPQLEAKLIYKNLYWHAVGADELPDAVRYSVFDGAVNSGVAQSIKWLQRALGVDDDGVIGPQTKAALAKADPHMIASRYSGHRLFFMTNLPTWKVFGSGWARRIAKNLMDAA